MDPSAAPPLTAIIRWHLSVSRTAEHDLLSTHQSSSGGIQIHGKHDQALSTCLSIWRSYKDDQQCLYNLLNWCQQLNDQTWIHFAVEIQHQQTIKSTIKCLNVRVSSQGLCLPTVSNMHRGWKDDRRLKIDLRLGTQYKSSYLPRWNNTPSTKQLINISKRSLGFMLRFCTSAEISSRARAFLFQIYFMVQISISTDKRSIGLKHSECKWEKWCQVKWVESLIPNMSPETVATASFFEVAWTSKNVRLRFNEKSTMRIFTLQVVPFTFYL